MYNNYIDVIKLFVDGGCLSNPGSGAIGLVIFDDKLNKLEGFSKCIGHTTNNQAEYQALIIGLRHSAKHTRHKVVCFSDSEIVVKQMNAVYRLKDDKLCELFYEVKKCASAFDEVIYQHVGRNNNNIKIAHQLVHDALEGRAVSV